MIGARAVLAVLLSLTLACSDDVGDQVSNLPMGNAADGVYALGVRWYGRIALDPAGPRFAWSGTGFSARVQGPLSMRLRNETNAPILFRAVIDGVPSLPFSSGRAEAIYPLVMTAGEHTVDVFRQTEGRQGTSQLLALEGELIDAPLPRARRIEVIGDSISAGYGALGKLSDSDCYATESHYESYASVLARKLSADLTTIAASGIGLSRNYGGDSELTMRELYPRTLANEATAWTVTTQPHAVVINLGSNDINGSKGDPGQLYEERYLALLDQLRARYPSALILCTIGPVLSGDDLTTMRARIAAVVEAFADPNVHFYGEIEPQSPAMFACAYHPNVAEHALMGEQLARELARLLAW